MGKTRRVAMMLELDWPYARHIGVFAGTQRYALEAGNWDCVVDEIAHETLRTGSRRRPAYDGVIARVTPQLAEEAQRCRVPLVNVWFNSPVAGLPTVVPDFARAGRMAAEHLLGLGLRRFACLSPPGERAVAAELDAYHEVIREAGGRCECAKVSVKYGSGLEGWRRFHNGVERWMARWSPPLGVYVTYADMTSRHLATECAKHELRVPEDVSIIAGLNEPMLCLHPTPSLTSVDVPYEEVGYRAAYLLDHLMKGNAQPAAPVLVPPVGVSARQSTNCLAVDDELVSAALHFLVANCHRDIAVTDVVHAAHSSRRTLERRFSDSLGRSIAGEIRRLRIERAKRHLADPALPIKTVAIMAGFANEQRLHEAFHRQEGMSPGQYRAERGVSRWQGRRS
jgi:LacI family transcriptional regulator